MAEKTSTVEYDDKFEEDNSVTETTKQTKNQIENENVQTTKVIASDVPGAVENSVPDEYEDNFEEPEKPSTASGEMYEQDFEEPAVVAVVPVDVARRSLIADSNPEVRGALDQMNALIAASGDADSPKKEIDETNEDPPTIVNKPVTPVGKAPSAMKRQPSGSEYSDMTSYFGKGVMDPNVSHGPAGKGKANTQMKGSVKAKQGKIPSPSRQSSLAGNKLSSPSIKSSGPKMTREPSRINREPSSKMTREPSSKLARGKSVRGSQKQEVESPYDMMSYFGRKSSMRGKK